MDKLIFHLPKSIGIKVVSFLSRKNIGVSDILREYYRRMYKVDVGKYSYGGCFSPDFNMGGIAVEYCKASKKNNKKMRLCYRFY